MKTSHARSLLGTTLAGTLAFTTTLSAQEAATDKEAREAELARQLSNPISSLISVPLQNNFDFGAGPNGDGFQYKLNLQPVVSFCISRQWTVPLVFLVAQLVNIGQTPVQFQLAGRYYAEKPAGGPDWGLRFAMVLLFPK